MNIASYFHTPYPEPLLFNADEGPGATGYTVDTIYAHVAGLSQRLKSLGIGPGDRVLLLSGNRVESYACLLAVWNCGAEAVPLNPRIGQQYLPDLIRRLAPVACCHDGPLDPLITGALAPLCRWYLNVAATRTEGFEGEMEESYRAVTASGAVLAFDDWPDEQPALLIHSSGSQGKPKAIRYSQAALRHYFDCHDRVHQQYADNGGADEPHNALISVFQPCHLVAISIALQGLLMRRPTWLMRTFVPDQYLRLLSTLHCRVAILVPAMYQTLLQEPESLAQGDYSALELCAAIGEAAPVSLLERIEEAFGVTAFSGYGLTECVPGIAHPKADLDAGTIVRGSCGKLLFDEARLVTKDGRESDTGELWLRNPTVHPCYDHASLNADRITPEGWLKTGDLFHRDTAGNFFHQGRMDDMFVCNGRNIYPAQVEAMLSRHPEVDAAVVAPVRDRQGKTCPAALLESHNYLSQEELADFCLDHGPAHAVPQLFAFCSGVPLLGPGKADRVACREILQMVFDAELSMQERMKKGRRKKRKAAVTH